VIDGCDRWPVINGPVIDDTVVGPRREAANRRDTAVA
jgi:hypothetical protein